MVWFLFIEREVRVNLDYSSLVHVPCHNCICLEFFVSCQGIVLLIVKL